MQELFAYSDLMLQRSRDGASLGRTGVSSLSVGKERPLLVEPTSSKLERTKERPTILFLI
jgi:hypothetical protein